MRIRYIILVIWLGIIILGLVLAIILYLGGILGINLSDIPYIIVVETFRLYFLVFLGGSALGLTLVGFYFYNRILEAKNTSQARERMFSIIIYYLIIAIVNVLAIIVLPTYVLPHSTINPLSTNSGLFIFVGSLISLMNGIILFLRKKDSKEAVSFFIALLLIIPSGFFIILGVISSFQNLTYYSIHPLLNSICMVGLGASSVTLYKLRNIYLTGRESPALKGIPASRISKKKEALPSKPEELSRQDRMKTNADYPERWALRQGLKPFEKENFQCFKEMTIDFQSKHLNPNFLHQKISYELENMGYRLLDNKKPLKSLRDLDRNSFKDGSIFPLKGQIKAQIRTERNRKESPYLFVFFISIFLIILGGFGVIFTSLTSLFYALLFLELLIIFLIMLGLGIGGVIFYFRIIPRASESIKGWANIYVLEEGFAYIGSFIRKEENYSYTMPIQSIELIITIAGAINKMSHSELQNDIINLKEQIQKFLNQGINLNSI